MKTKSTKTISLVPILLSFLTGCLTPYQSYQHNSKDRQLARDVFLVSYHGYYYNFPTEMARNLALLRAADVTLSHGFNYFLVTEENRCFTPGMASGDYKPDVVLKIRCYIDKPADPEALDAAFLQHSLMEKYKFK